jgi:hypothetical protein
MLTTKKHRIIENICIITSGIGAGVGFFYKQALYAALPVAVIAIYLSRLQREKYEHQIEKNHHDIHHLEEKLNGNVEYFEDAIAALPNNMIGYYTQRLAPLLSQLQSQQKMTQETIATLQKDFRENWQFISDLGKRIDEIDEDFQQRGEMKDIKKIKEVLSTIYQSFHKYVSTSVFQEELINVSQSINSLKNQEDKIIKELASLAQKNHLNNNLINEYELRLNDFVKTNNLKQLEEKLSKYVSNKEFREYHDQICSLMEQNSYSVDKQIIKEIEGEIAHLQISINNFVTIDTLSDIMEDFLSKKEIEDLENQINQLNDKFNQNENLTVLTKIKNILGSLVKREDLDYLQQQFQEFDYQFHHRPEIQTIEGIQVKIEEINKTILPLLSMDKPIKYINQPLLQTNTNKKEKGVFPMNNNYDSQNIKENDQYNEFDEFESYFEDDLYSEEEIEEAQVDYSLQSQLLSNHPIFKQNYNYDQNDSYNDGYDDFYDDNIDYDVNEINSIYDIDDPEEIDNIDDIYGLNELERIQNSSPRSVVTKKGNIKEIFIQNIQTQIEFLNNQLNHILEMELTENTYNVSNPLINKDYSLMKEHLQDIQGQITVLNEAVKDLPSREVIDQLTVLLEKGESLSEKDTVIEELITGDGELSTISQEKWQIQQEQIHQLLERVNQQENLEKIEEIEAEVISLRQQINQIIDQDSSSNSYQDDSIINDFHIQLTDLRNKLNNSASIENFLELQNQFSSFSQQVNEPIISTNNQENSAQLEELKTELLRVKEELNNIVNFDGFQSIQGQINNLTSKIENINSTELNSEYDEIIKTLAVSFEQSLDLFATNEQIETIEIKLNDLISKNNEQIEVNETLAQIQNYLTVINQSLENNDNITNSTEIIEEVKKSVEEIKTEEITQIHQAMIELQSQLNQTNQKIDLLPSMEQITDLIIALKTMATKEDLTNVAENLNRKLEDYITWQELGEDKTLQQLILEKTQN